MIRTLREQLAQEVGWLESGMEDALPSMIRPLERAEAQYIFSQGEQRLWRTSSAPGPSRGGLNAEEATPLLPNNDGIPTAPGSNEVFRWSGWAGFGGFLTAYGEGAATGPFTRAININHGDRLRPLGTAIVASLGNFAISLGTEEMWWGAGHYGTLSQSNNATPFPAVRIQNLHPTLLPGLLRYLGQFRYQMFFGQLDDDRYFAHPWIDGQAFSFKPLPYFEFGGTHTIDFGGRHNDNYSALGFIGRASGFATGDPTVGDTHQRVNFYLKLHVRRLRNAEFYGEVTGETFFKPFGRSLPIKTPFKLPSWQFGFYIPRLTADGLTDARVEYTITNKNYAVHDDALYWTYNGKLMGDYLGPDATGINVAIGRWIALQSRAELGFYYSERAPTWGPNRPYPASIYGSNLTKERAEGIELNLLRLDVPVHRYGDGLLTGLAAKIAAENVHALNYRRANNSVRLIISFTASLSSDFNLKWR